MKTYKGNAEITKANQENWKDVVKITGDVLVDGQATLPALAEVGGDVRVDGQATLNAPALAEVGGDVRVDGQATLPALAEVGGYVLVYGQATLPPKEKIGNSPKPMRPISKKFQSKGYLFADRILSRLISKRKHGAVIIFKTAKIGNRRKVLYVVQRGELFAHGETVKQATHDLRYKLADRDTTKYKGWTAASVHSIADVIGAYRAITGACEAGTKGFCEGKELPANLSVKVAIRLTRGAYGGEKFAAFFADKKGE